MHNLLAAEFILTIPALLGIYSPSFWDCLPLPSKIHGG